MGRLQQCGENARLVCRATLNEEKYCDYKVIFVNIRHKATIPSLGNASES